MKKYLLIVICILIATPIVVFGLDGGEFRKSVYTRDYYAFNGTTTSATAAHNPIRLQAITYSTTARFGGQSLFFNGTSTVVQLAGEDQDGTNLTISAWIRTTSTSSTFYVYANQGAGNYFAWMRNSQTVYASNNINCFFRQPDGTAQQVTHPMAINDGKWHNVICTKSATQAKIYIDGNLGDVDVVSVGNPFDAGASVCIGNQPIRINHTCAGERFAGYMDEVIIELRTWSAQEVVKYYQRAVGRIAPKLR